MPEPVPRVIVLARPGEACDRLQDAVRGAGAELVGAFDPLAATVEALAGTAAQAVVVALEPAVEEALDDFQPLLADPAITVVFDEAELAAQRSGWDAARWVRPLAAKLHRHDDVLPPGAGQAEPSLPSALQVSGTRDGAMSAQESGHLADAVHAADPGAPHDADPAPALPVTAAIASGLELEEIVLDAEPGPAAATSLDEIALGGIAIDDVVLDTGDDDAAASDGGFGELTLEGLTLDDLVLDDGTDAAGDGEPRGERTYLEPVDLTWDAAPSADDAGVPSAPAADVAAAPIDTGGLSLADPGEAPIASVPSRAAAGLGDLESRIGGLSLLDPDSYGHGELQGAVLVEGGLGGPDPVRQLLAALPDDFPRSLLVRLRLDGGRYDRLVRQMARATSLPVALAEEAGVLDRGTVYFLPPGIGVAAERGQLCFVAAAEESTGLPDALPADDSAVVFLSGADAALVDQAMGDGWAGALVLGQSQDGCYDAAASARVAERGGTLAAPADLAALLVARWAPAATGTSIELETRDE